MVQCPNFCVEIIYFINEIFFSFVLVPFSPFLVLCTLVKSVPVLKVNFTVFFFNYCVVFCSNQVSIHNKTLVICYLEFTRCPGLYGEPEAQCGD
jgi:hypothetical protein